MLIHSLLRKCIGGHDLVMWHKAYSQRAMGDSNDVCSPWRLALELLQQRSKQKRRMNTEADKTEGMNGSHCTILWTFDYYNNNARITNILLLLDYRVDAVLCHY